VTRGNNNRTKRLAARGFTTSASGVKRSKITPVSAANGNAMNVNNATKRRSNLNAYINNLQRQLSERGKLNKLNKPRYLSELNQKNSNDALAAIKARAKANAQRIANSK